MVRNSQKTVFLRMRRSSRQPFQDVCHRSRRAMNGVQVWPAPVSPAGAPGAHHEGGTRMGSNPDDSVVNKYGHTWDHPNLFLIGSSTFPTMGAGFNPTLTIQALAYMSADAIVNRYRKHPGPLI